MTLAAMLIAYGWAAFALGWVAGLARGRIRAARRFFAMTQRELSEFQERLEIIKRDAKP